MSPNWPRNRLLLALPSSSLKRLMPELEQIPCPREEILLDADSALEHVFFPDSGVASVVAVYANGDTIETATIGREGYAPVNAVFGAKLSSERLLVQIPGGAVKMSRAAFTRALRSMPPFRNLTLSYVQAFVEQLQVSVACNGAHSLKERLTRWLLMMRDRAAASGHALELLDLGERSTALVRYAFAFSRARRRGLGRPLSSSGCRGRQCTHRHYKVCPGIGSFRGCCT